MNGYEELTLREFIEAISKYEKFMDMKVVSLGGGTGGKLGCFNLIHLKDNDNKDHEIHIAHYKTGVNK